VTWNVHVLAADGNFPCLKSLNINGKRRIGAVMSQDRQSHLKHVLDARGLNLDPGDLATAVESPDIKDQLCRWIDEYLSPETLLTKEELSL
jgi:hypothetical protein